MAEAAAADADRDRSPDTTPASQKPADDAAPAATGTTQGGGVGDMALQRKAEVGRSDDPLEKEADAVAHRIMRATEPPAPAPERPSDAGPATPAEPIRRKASGDASGPEGGELPDSVRHYLEQSKGTGSPLPEAARTFFEAKFAGAHFGDVRVHDDPGANEAARLIGAVAFTRSSDIYFAAGAYDPVSEGGRAVLAHELTHVVQQSGSAGAPSWRPVEPAAVTPDGPSVIRRVGGTPAPALPTPPPSRDGTNKGPRASLTGPWHGTKGSVDVTPGQKAILQVKELPVPQIKLGPTRGSRFPLVLNPAARPNTQMAIWEAGAAPFTDTKVRQRLQSLAPTPPPDEIYRVRWGHAPPRGAVPPAVQARGGNPPVGLRPGYLFGTMQEIVERMRRPPWNPKARSSREDFDVDHQVEWQLGGDEAMSNFWLLESSTNRSLGGTISGNINRAIDQVLAEASTKPPGAVAAPLPVRPAVRTVRQTWEVQILAVTGGPSGPGVRAGTPPSWVPRQLAAESFDNLELVGKSELEPADPVNNYVVFFDRTGGRRVEVNAANPQWEESKSFKVERIDKAAKKAVVAVYPNAHPRIKGGTQDINLAPIAGLSNVGFFDLNRRTAARNLTFNGLSPLEFEDIRFDPGSGLVGGARIPKPDVPLLNDIEIGVRLNGADVQAYATIQGGALKLPSPFQVTGGALDLAVGLQGFSVSGDVTFEIKNLARGRVFGRGNLGAHSGFALGGELEFDTKMFTKAKLGLTYDAEKGWGVTGELAVGQNKVKGIKSASATVEVKDKEVSANGTFETSLKGIEKGKLSFNYHPTNGMEVAGQLSIGKLPGIEGGTVDATVKQTADGYSLSGGITAKPSIPGVTGSVTGKYEDGAFLAQADLGYHKGMLDGRVKLGVTNQAVTAGIPAGPATEKLTTWGGGQVTIKIAPWLQGTIGLELDPKGSLTVKGEVALPDAVTLFPEKKVDKNIFKIGLDIPIVGVAVAGQRIGIFATIQGGLDASAGFGPGQLRGLSLSVTYNPDDEAATQVHGHAEAFVPAHAGLKLFVKGGLGAGVPVVSATAGLEVSGALGLEGAATAAVDVNWTPAAGLVIDAKGEIFVEPKFRFAIEAYVDVSADLYITTIELYKKKWSLASFEYGSGLRFGVKFPVHYEQGKEFDLSLSQVEFVYPSIDPGALLKGLVSQVI